MADLTLSEINIYPIKSTAGISLETALAEIRGLQHDRRWLLVDETKLFLTQREYPRMALISTTLTPEGLEVNAPGMTPLSIPFPKNIDPIPVQVWRTECLALSAGETAQAWFSQFLEIPTQLVYMPEESLRPINPDYAQPGDHVSFADGYPYLLISEASLEDLNQRLEEPLPMNRFRPNLVVKGCQPYEEDQWLRIRIGTTQFRIAKPCDRCMITTIDQCTTTGGKEPLRTLAQYRKIEGKVFFGQNLIPEQTGAIHSNDSVEVLEKK